MKRKKLIRLAVMVAALAVVAGFGTPSETEANLVNCYMGGDCETDCHTIHCECQNQCTEEFVIRVLMGDVGPNDPLLECKQDCDVDLSNCVLWCW